MKTKAVNRRKKWQIYEHLHLHEKCGQIARFETWYKRKKTNLCAIVFGLMIGVEIFVQHFFPMSMSVSGQKMSGDGGVRVGLLLN